MEHGFSDFLADEKNKHHIAMYNNKEVVIDYVKNPKDEFKVACQRIYDNLGTGPTPTDVGYVLCPDGKKYEISRTNKRAILVKEEEEKMKSFKDFLKEEELKEDDTDVNIDELNTGEVVNDTVEIYFADLSEDKQKGIMDALIEALNATKDDDYSNKKITEQLGTKPIFIIKGSDLKNQLGIKI